MSKRAWAYIWGVLLSGATLSALALGKITVSETELLAFGVMACLAIVSQLFEAEHGKQSFYPHFVFFIAAMLTLQPGLFVLVVTIPHLVEWVKERVTDSSHLKAWYIQPFNICVHIIAGGVAWRIYQSLQSYQPDTISFAPVLWASASVIAYVLINHVLIGMALVLARSISWKQSAILEFECLLPDIILAYLGYVVAVLWTINPWFTVPAVLPLVLMYRALMIPQLKQEAQTDGKTGLWNARHFTRLFTAEMERAQRFNRPLTVIMADLDLLRNINNTYGHLAGDTVLAGIGEIIKQNIREYDIAGRFGGEEFAIVLPETGPTEAHALAERLRAAVEDAVFQVSTSQTPISCTMSIGVACCPWDATTVTDLIHEADVAVYQAKLRGRNCVICAGDVPHSVKLEHAPSDERVSSPYTGSFSPRPVQPRPIPQPPTPEAPHEVYAEVAGNGLVASAASTVASKNEASPEEHANKLSAAVITVHLQDPEEQPARSNAAQPQAATAQKAPESVTAFPGWSMAAFIAVVTATGIVLALIGFMTTGNVDWTAVALLTGLAVGAELLQVDLYGDSTVSVSVALAFAVALLTGLPGVICISAAIAIAHYILVKPAIYKTPVNWATHLLAGSMPALVTMALPVPLTASNLILLAIPLGGAAIAYYALETGIIAVAISLSRGTNVVTTWRAQFRWLANHYLVLCMMGTFLAIAYTALGPVGVLVFALPIVMMRYSQKQYVDRTEDSMKELKRMNQELTQANREVVIASKALGQLNEELFFTLAKIIDARDPYVSGHASKVSDYAMAIATELKLPTEIMEPLRQAGFLHDIGKIGISEEILQKPAKLTPEEYEIMKTHAGLGGEFLETCGALRHLAPFVRHHHEWWNGKGYPDGLSGEEIPLESRILSVCDAAEAMASDRPYRKGMSVIEIIAEIERCAGTQFDPVVAAAFVRIAEREREHLVINSAHEVLRKQASGLKAGAPSPVGRPSLEKELPALTMG